MEKLEETVAMLREAAVKGAASDEETYRDAAVVWELAANGIVELLEIRARVSGLLQYPAELDLFTNLAVHSARTYLGPGSPGVCGPS